MNYSPLGSYTVNCIIHRCVNLKRTLHVHHASVSAVEVYTVSAPCPGDHAGSVHWKCTGTGKWTDSVYYSCNAVHAHPVCKCCRLCNALTHQVVQIALMVHLLRTKGAPHAPALLCCEEKLLQFSIFAQSNAFLAQNLLRAWHIAVPKNGGLQQFSGTIMCQATTDRTSSDGSRDRGRPQQLLSCIGQVVSAWGQCTFYLRFVSTQCAVFAVVIFI